jgi:hypothetical protein
MATVPATQSFLAGEKVTAAKLTAATKTPLDFLLNPPRVNAFATAGTVCPTGISTLITFDGEAWDTDGMHSTTNPSRITINTPGQYLVSIYARFPINATGYRSLNLRLNSGGNSGAGSTLSTISVAPTPGSATTMVTRTLELTCNAGDHYELFASQSSGANMTLDVGQRVTAMEFRWLGLTT